MGLELEKKKIFYGQKYPMCHFSVFRAKGRDFGIPKTWRKW